LYHCRTLGPLNTPLDVIREAKYIRSIEIRQLQRETHATAKARSIKACNILEVMKVVILIRSGKYCNAHFVCDGGEGRALSFIT